MSNRNGTPSGDDPRALAPGGDEFDAVRRAELRQLIDELEHLSSAARKLSDLGTEAPRDLGENIAVIAGMVRRDLAGLDALGWL